MKKNMVFLCVGLTFSSLATADFSAMVQAGVVDYELSFNYDGNKNTAIDSSHFSRDLILNYSHSPWDIKFGVKVGGLSTTESAEVGDGYSVNVSANRPETSIFATKNVYGIPLTIGYYSSTLQYAAAYSDGDTETVELENNGFFVSGSYLKPLADKYGAFVKLGFQSSSVEDRVQYTYGGSSAAYSTKFDGTALSYGIGFYYAINSKSSIVGTYEKKDFSYDDDYVLEEMSGFSIGYSYNL